MFELYRSGVKGVRRDSSLVQGMGINLEYGKVDTYELLVPIIDTDVSMKWLMDLVERKGGKLVTDSIDVDLLTQEQTLLAHFNADAIVNATGLASKELALDSTCYPLGGALLPFINDSQDFLKVIAAICIAADAPPDNEIIFLVPRNDNILVFGSTVQREEWSLDLTLDSPILKRMRARCEDFLPCLKIARLDFEDPLAQGLQPGKEANNRVERETRNHGTLPSRIVHFYGHGGSGWSLSFGCAEEVAGTVEDVLLNDVSKSGIVRSRL